MAQNSDDATRPYGPDEYKPEDVEIDGYEKSEKTPDEFPSREIQNSTRLSLRDALNAGKDLAWSMDRKKHIAKMARSAKELEMLSADKDPQVGQYMEDHLLHELHLAYADKLKRDKAPPEFLKEQQRWKFRKKVFMKACDAKLFDLEPGDKPYGEMSLETLKEHMLKKLGKKNAATFSRICNGYDGDDTLHALAKGIGRAVKGREEYKNRAEIRSEDRAKLHGEITGEFLQRIPQAAIEPAKLVSFLREGGDAALKFGGVMLGVAVGGWAGLAVGGSLWLAKPILETAGFDFGHVVQRAMSKAGHAAKVSGKDLMRAMPKNAQEKLPKGFARSLETMPAASPERLGRASFSMLEGAQRFLRGVVPFGNLWGKIDALAPYFGSESNADLIASQGIEQEKSLHGICEEILNGYRPAAPAQAQAVPRKKRRAEPSPNSSSEASAPNP